jgi:hypothetical protein
MIGVQSDFARYGDAALVAAEVVSPGLETKLDSDKAQLAARLYMEAVFGVVVISDGLSEIERGCCLGSRHGQAPELRRRAADALSRA